MSPARHITIRQTTRYATNEAGERYRFFDIEFHEGPTLHGTLHVPDLREMHTVCREWIVYGILPTDIRDGEGFRL